MQNACAAPADARGAADADENRLIDSSPLSLIGRDQTCERPKMIGQHDEGGVKARLGMSCASQEELRGLATERLCALG
jgi:hypothetical protein